MQTPNGRQPKNKNAECIALCYIRKSLVRGESDLYSPERQRRNQAAWCELHGYEPEFYVDAEGHRSGRSEARRPEWQRLKEQLERPEVKAVVVETVSRSHRNLKELLQFVDLADRHGVAYASIQEGFDAGTAMGRLALQLVGAFAEAWSNLTSEKMQETVAMLKSDGKYWGPVPFATVRDEAMRLAPSPAGAWWDPEHAVWEAGQSAQDPDRDKWTWRGYHEALARCYELYAAGQHGYATAADELNREGWRYRSKQGEPVPWLREHVRLCLYNWREYAGQLTDGRADALQPRQVLVEDAWPPILPLELIEEARRVLSERGRGNRVSSPTTLYELTPLLHCARCGKTLEGITSRQGVRNYRHASRDSCAVGRTRADPLEEQARALLAAFHVPEGVLPLLEEMITAFTGDEEEEEEDGQLQLARLRGKRRRLRDLYLEGDFSRDEYQARAMLLDGEISALEERLDSTTPGTLGAILERLAHLDKLVEHAEPAERKVLLATVFQRIDVDVGTGQIVGYTPREWVRPFF